MSPSSVPPQAPSSGRPLPSVGFPGVSSPTSAVISADSDFSPSVAHHFVSFAQHYHRFALLCSPGAGRFPRGPGPLLSRRPRRLCTVEKTRPPRFLGDPCVHAPLFDPGGPPAPGPYRTGDVVFRQVNDVDSAWDTFEAQSRGLHALCVRFAAGVAPGPRNTRFRLVASLDRSGLSPAGSRRRFPSCLSVYMAFPFTKLCLAQ